MRHYLLVAAPTVVLLAVHSFSIPTTTKARSNRWVQSSARILQRTNAFPTTGIGGHQAKIINDDLSRESSVAFVAIRVLSNSRVALRQRLNRKLRELDPSGNDRLAASDLEVEPPDRESIGRRRQREINVVATAHAGQLLTRTAPYATALHAQAEGLHVAPDCALDLNLMG